MNDEKARRRLLNTVVALTSALVAAGFLVVAELALRRIYPAPPDLQYERFLEQSLAFLEPCSQLAALDDAASGRPRIVVLGESSGQLLGDALGRLVSEGAPARIANCAQGGAALAHVVSRFDAAMAAHPDAIVIVFGHNYDFDDPMTRWQINLQYLRLRSRLMSLPANLLLPPLPGVERKVRDLAPFEAFLRRAARRCREQGVRLIMATMTSNYFYPPNTSMNVPSAVFEIRLLRMTNPAEASKRLAKIAADNAGAAFELGIWLDQDGDREGARAALERALFLDSTRFRAAGAQAEMIRRVAADEGVMLRDTARARAADAPDGITGWESVADNCHLHLDLFVDEAVAVLDLLGVPPPAVRDKKVEQVEDDHFGAILRYLRMWTEASLSNERPWLVIVPIWRFLQLDEPRIEQRVDDWIEERARESGASAGNVRSLLLNASGDAHWLAGKRQRARVLNERARAASPATSPPWVSKGLYDVAEGRNDEARAAFTKALEIEPARRDAEIYLERLPQSPE